MYSNFIHDDRDVFSRAPWPGDQYRSLTAGGLNFFYTFTKDYSSAHTL